MSNSLQSTDNLLSPVDDKLSETKVSELKLVLRKDPEVQKLARSPGSTVPRKPYRPPHPLAIPKCRPLWGRIL